MIPNGATIKSTEEGVILLSPLLLIEASTASIIPELKNSSLISLGQLADDDCTILLNKKKLFAIKEEQIVLEGYRNKVDGLWDIPIQKRTITENNFRILSIHPSIYPSRAKIKSTCNAILPSKKKIERHSEDQFDLYKFRHFTSETSKNE